MRRSRWVAAAASLLVWPGLALAADLDGSHLSPLWGVPFAGLLLSIALMPLLLPFFWHHHFGKVSAAWTLTAISAGAVFKGANTYIGNAPNLMVKAIAEDRGVKMPSFFGYMAWSGAVLIPLFVLMTFIWFT